jgi:hypothetical protein
VEIDEIRHGELLDVSQPLKPAGINRRSFFGQELDELVDRIRLRGNYLQSCHDSGGSLAWLPAFERLLGGIELKAHIAPA